MGWVLKLELIIDLLVTHYSHWWYARCRWSKDQKIFKVYILRDVLFIATFIKGWVRDWPTDFLYGSKLIQLFHTASCGGLLPKIDSHGRNESRDRNDEEGGWIVQAWALALTGGRPVRWPMGDQPHWEAAHVRSERLSDYRRLSCFTPCLPLNTPSSLSKTS